MLDKDHLEYAIQLAKTQAGLAGKDVPIGAVILDRNGNVIAKAHNECEMRHDSLAHAEILAIKEAIAKEGVETLNGFVLVATLEPCLMCFGACINAGISDVYYLASSSLNGAFSKFHINEAINAHYLPDEDEAKKLKVFFEGVRKSY